MPEPYCSNRAIGPNKIGLIRKSNADKDLWQSVRMMRRAVGMVDNRSIGRLATSVGRSSTKIVRLPIKMAGFLDTWADK